MADSFTIVLWMPPWPPRVLHETNLSVAVSAKSVDLVINAHLGITIHHVPLNQDVVEGLIQY